MGQFEIESYYLFFKYKFLNAGSLSIVLTYH